MDTMITIILVSLIAIILFISWKYEKDQGTYSPWESLKKIPKWVIISLLTILVIVYPKFRFKIRDLQRRYHI